MSDTTYDVTVDDVGHQLVLVVTATNTAGSVTVESAPTSIVSDWIDIPGATGTSYTLVADDLNHEVRLKVTARNTAGAVAAASLPVGPVTSPVQPGTGGTELDVVDDDVGLVELRIQQRGVTT